MGRIRVLDKHVASLIAAGEVVQRSGSVIKELVENSIDAGSTSIIVEIKGGGSLFMRVSDNGCGMSEEDAKLCLLRHATSKIYDASGLESITSLGFRGEALASICTVSRMEIITRMEDDAMGVSMKSEGGEVISVSKAGCPVGTTIIVRDLFYNTPARLKFLKRDAAEAAHIADIASRIALGNTNIAIKLIRDSKSVLQTYGDGDLKNAAYAVWGKKVIEGMVDVYYEKSGIVVSGLTCAPYAAKNNRSFQNFYINGRYIRSPLLSSALQEAYGPNLFTGKFPSCIINIELSPSSVDVNVDPEKLTVKFSEERALFDAVYFAIKSALSEQNTKSAELNTEKKKEDNEPLLKYTPVQTTFIASRMQDEQAASTARFKQENVFSPSKEQEPVKSEHLNEQTSMFSGGFIKVTAIENTEAPKILKEDLPEIRIKETLKKETPPLEKFDIIDVTGAGDLDVSIVGELYRTYIIALRGGITYIIDKHAAHERIIFERIKGRTKPSSQILLQPQGVRLSPKDFERIMENLECFEGVGFEIEDFGGNTLLVRAVPYDMAEAQVESAIYEIVEQLKRTHGRITESITDEMMKTVACKAAIKAGYKTSGTEMETLAKEVLSDERYRYCPHGRPTYLKLTEDDLKKQFSRT